MTLWWLLALALALALVALALRDPASHEAFRRKKTTTKWKKWETKKTKKKKKKWEMEGRDRNGGGGGGGNKSGVATFYWAREKDVGHGTGNKGACYNNKLTAFRSLAVRCGQWRRLRGMKVQYKLEGKGGWRTGVVEDVCKGPRCRDFDVYVGETKKKNYDGRPKITYKLLGKDPRNRCTNLNYNPC